MSVTAIILTKNEAIHIGRAVDSASRVAERVVVVDSESIDDTCDIARRHGAEVAVIPWKGNQAAQFNAALDTLYITTDWILRLDADEYLSDGLVDEINDVLPTVGTDVSAVLLPLGRCFMGRRLKHGIVGGIRIVRLMRRGCCRYEQRCMDEHLDIKKGRVIEFRNEFVDDNLMPLSYFISKHVGYAEREASLALADIKNKDYSAENNLHLADKVAKKRKLKGRYYRMPKYWRAAGYFFYRYVIKLGFLDGREGFLWDFLQGFWYRVLVDSLIDEKLAKK